MVLKVFFFWEKVVLEVDLPYIALLYLHTTPPWTSVLVFDCKSLQSYVESHRPRPVICIMKHIFVQSKGNSRRRLDTYKILPCFCLLFFLLWSAMNMTSMNDNKKNDKALIPTFWDRL